MKLKTLICAAAAFGACCSCTSGELSPVDYVDPFIGTGFHGHTYPGATVPFGAVQLSLTRVPETGMLAQGIIMMIRL